MKQRLILTAIWFAGLVFCVLGAASYMFVRDANGVPLLHWDESARVLKSVLVVYAMYLGGILAFWFFRPFPDRGSRPALERIRFGLAWIGAVIVNLAFLAWILVGYWYPEAVLGDILDARNIVIWLSFIVGPANVYYFGLRAAG